MQIDPYNYSGVDYWRIDVNPQITDFELFNFPGGAHAAIGMDKATNTYKVSYLLYPQSVYSQEELESNEQVNKILQKCNICSVLNQIEDSTGGVSSSMRKVMPMSSRLSTQADVMPMISRPSSPISAVPMTATSETSQGIFQDATTEAVRPSAGDVIQPKYLPVITNLGKQVFCTSLGSVAVSTLMSLFADMMAGWADDPGHRKAFQQMSDEFIASANICPADAGKLRNDIARLYNAYKQDGMVPALKAGMFKDVTQSLKENGINVKADVAVKARGHVGFEARSLVD